MTAKVNSLEKKKVDLTTTVAAVKLKNPLLAASGTWAYGLEFLDHPVQDSLGGFVTKSLSIRPSQGNPMPRIYETEAGMLNSIGLQNMGIDAFLLTVEPKLKERHTPFVLSVYANRVEDFEALAEKATASSCLAVELNISCPNIDKGGLEFSSDPKTTETVVGHVRKLLKQKALWVKLSPNVTSIADIAVAAESAGADALSMINTLLGMAIDVEAKKPWLGRLVGGLSGPAIRPVAVERVFRCFKRVKIPIVGMGGIRTARDVLEFVLAGASAVQVGTWNFKNPFVYRELLQGIESYMMRQGIQKFSDLIGLAHSKGSN